MGCGASASGGHGEAVDIQVPGDPGTPAAREATSKNADAGGPRKRRREAGHENASAARPRDRNGKHKRPTARQGRKRKREDGRKKTNARTARSLFRFRSKTKTREPREIEKRFSLFNQQVKSRKPREIDAIEQVKLRGIAPLAPQFMLRPGAQHEVIIFKDRIINDESHE